MTRKKSKQFSLRAFLCIFFLFFSPKTSPAQELVPENIYEPLSVELIQYMGKESLGTYQVYLSGTLVLEGVKARNIHGALELTGGGTIITIKENTRAVITGLTEKDSALFLRVCFEADTALYLIFAQNLDGDFSLYHQEGVVRYGGDLYRVDREAAATAALHISVSRKDEDGVNRVAEGREAAKTEVKEPQDTPINSGPGYKIQVGAYKNPAIAQKARSRLETAGFSPRFEMYRDFYRVFISGISAKEKDAVVQRLALAGFSEIWIRD